MLKGDNLNSRKIFMNYTYFLKGIIITFQFIFKIICNNNIHKENNFKYDYNFY